MIHCVCFIFLPFFVFRVSMRRIFPASEHSPALDDADNDHDQGDDEEDVNESSHRVRVLVKQVHQEIADTKSRRRVSDTPRVVLLPVYDDFPSRIRNTTEPKVQEGVFRVPDKQRSLKSSSFPRIHPPRVRSAPLVVENGIVLAHAGSTRAV